MESCPNEKKQAHVTNNIVFIFVHLVCIRILLPDFKICYCFSFKTVQKPRDYSPSSH